MITEELRNIVQAAGLVPDGGQVHQVLAALQAMFLSSAFFGGSNQSLGSSGYLKLPGGFMLQWGSGTTVAGAASITFPIAFPVAAYHVTATVVRSSTTTNSIGFSGAASLTGATFYDQGATSTAFTWLAIGRY